MTHRSNGEDALGIVVLISGRGSNLDALIDAIGRGDVPARIQAVISNRPNAPGLACATAAHIPTRVLDHTDFNDRASFDGKLMTLIDEYRPGLVVLAGFMRLLTPQFVQHYAGRLLNIHPSLLPAYRGLDTHARALADGATEHGASVHFVTVDLDGGPVIVQAIVPVLRDDTAETLAARVLKREHVIYPLAIKWFTEGRLTWHDGVALFDGNALITPRQIAYTGENEI